VLGGGLDRITGLAAGWCACWQWRGAQSLDLDRDDQAWLPPLRVQALPSGPELELHWVIVAAARGQGVCTLGLRGLSASCRPYSETGSAVLQLVLGRRSPWLVAADRPAPWCFGGSAGDPCSASVTYWKDSCIVCAVTPGGQQGLTVAAAEGRRSVVGPETTRVWNAVAAPWHQVDRSALRFLGTASGADRDGFARWPSSACWREAGIAASKCLSTWMVRLKPFESGALTVRPSPWRRRGGAWDD